MHDRFRKEFEYVWPKDFVLYYRQRLLPRSGRLGRYENSQKIARKCQKTDFQAKIILFQYLFQVGPSQAQYL